MKQWVWTGGGLRSGSSTQEASHSVEQLVESCLVGDPWVSRGMCHLDATSCLDHLCAKGVCLGYRKTSPVF